MAEGLLKFRLNPQPIRLRPDRFEALVAAHEAFLQGRRGGRRSALPFIVAHGVACEGRALADAHFDGADFTGSSFVRSDFTRASFYCANLSRCDFREAQLVRADLRGCTFNGATLAGANLDGADLRAAVLLSMDDMRGLRWMGGREALGAEPELGQTHSVDFSDCSLQGAKLKDANLKNANFRNANLHGAELVGARLEGAKLTGAILTGVDLARLDVPRLALEGCVVDPTPEARAAVAEIEAELERAQDWVAKAGRPADLRNRDLRPATGLFQGRLLAGLQAAGAQAIGVDFSGAQLQGASFAGADLRAADFTDADLRGASFKDANLAHAKLGGADIGALELGPGVALPTNFAGAKLAGIALPDQPAPDA